MKFYIERLGCPKNDVDADYMAGRLISEGHEQVAGADQAEAVIVNTCGFILPAKQESIGELLRFAQLRKEGRLKRLIAAGCLSQLHGDELLSEMPELDFACGLGALDDITRALEDGATRNDKTLKVATRDLTYLSSPERYIDPATPYAYLKISDGCDRKCSYCIIPQMRGSFRSRPIDEIVAEARLLARSGKKELILVSQEATLYGCETGKKLLLPLLDELQKIEGIEWIRLVYLHPHALDSSLIDYLGNSDKVLQYYDLPLQHISDGVLKRMRRQVRRAKIEKILTEIRSKQPGSIIRTTFIVGFPGETEEQFVELYDFAAEFKFDRMGAFAYSQEEGSSASLMPDQIPEKEKTSRLEALTDLQTDIVSARNMELIGARVAVLIDSAANGRPAIGRTYGDCPDIDQIVSVHETRPRLKSGDMCQALIESSSGHDLLARAV